MYAASRIDAPMSNTVLACCLHSHHSVFQHHQQSTSNIMLFLSSYLYHCYILSVLFIIIAKCFIDNNILIFSDCVTHSVVIRR